MLSTSQKMDWTHALALGLCLLAASACGDQATHNYLGEPLFSMRGRVEVDAQNAATASVPALCFHDVWRGETPSLDLLPAAVRKDFGGLVIFGPEGEFVHIVDVESRGQFPAEFDIDVYVPPPAAAIKPCFSGEPRAAEGIVCAVAPDHPATAQRVMIIGTKFENPDPGTRMLNGQFLSAYSWS